MNIKEINGEMLKKMFIQGNNLLYSNRDIVDSLNVFPVPDGDTGTNMSLTFESAVNEISKLEKLTVEDISKSAAKGSLMGARGNSGVILSQILRGFEKGCRGKQTLTVIDFANALKEASNTAYKAVMKPIEGTILTVIRETSERALEISNNNMNLLDFFSSIISHAEAVLDKTPQMLDALKQAGVVDAGGKGLVFVFKGFWEAISGKEILEPEVKKIELNQEKITKDTHIEFGYCTEIIVEGNKIDLEEFKQKIKSFGDCLLVVGDSDLMKVHIHTNNPGRIIEFGLEVGELIDIKIDNMRYQHNNKHNIKGNEEINEDTNQDINNDMKEYGFITVVMGEGLKSIFKDLNVDKVIQGGQTMNPSTEDILKAVNEINSENIIILPNNSNIILAANQAKELSEKNVIVIPTKTIPQGIASMLQFDPAIDVEANKEKMIEVLKDVSTVQITYSIRDSKFNDFDIKKDDILGIFDGEIDIVGNEVSQVALDVLNKQINEDHEILTIYYGEDVSEEEAENLSSLIEESYPDLDIEIYYGGQPLYYYIISIE